jgi:hypothetical protein
MPILVLLISTFLPLTAWAYPEFIGYKYASCLTCHFNGNGNGPLNDYGRALWSAEIAGRAFSGGKSEDQLSQSSGFLGSTELPWWIRPGLKARDLYLKPNPGGTGGKSMNVFMQGDANVALLFDRDQKYAFVGSFGYAPQPKRIKSTPGAAKVPDWISREHYLRVQASETLWFYVGMLDKPYGIRIVDHTAYSRAKVGVAQNDQAHGVIAQFIKPNWELSLDGFAGNLYQKSDLRQKGASALFEYEVMQAMRVGASALVSSNSYLGEERFAFHTRTGLGYGSAILFEIGFINNKPKGQSAMLGYYTYAEAIQRMTRGYHLFLAGQSYQDELKGGHNNNIGGSIGLLMFPLARVEFRLELQSNRQFNDSSSVAPESWSALAQVHLSL